MDAKELQEFTQFKETYDAYKAVASNQTGQLVHGPTGLFSQPGLDPNVFSALLKPRGLGAVLRKVATLFTNPQYPILTGQEDDVGTEPDDSCGDPVRAGFKKLCTLTAQFGLLQRGTNTIDPRQIITLINRGEFTDLRLFGTLLDNEAGFSPGGLPSEDIILNNAVANELHGVAISFVRTLAQQLWQGVVTNNTNGFKQFPGLDSQITTGQVDSVTGVACSAADSFLRDFNFTLVGASSGNDIVEFVSDVEWQLISEDRRIGLDVNRVIVMRPELWQEFTAVWPIAYNTNRGATALRDNNTRLVVSGEAMIEIRDQLRKSMTLEVNARTYKVVVDDGINELTNITNGNLAAGQYASDIYFVPVDANGIPVTRLEYLDYRQINKMVSKIPNLAKKVTFWTNDGIYGWVYRDLPGFCFDIVGSTEIRVICQTPHLAGRIQNVAYQPLEHLRSPYPDSPYFQDGGVSTRDASTFQHTNAVWN